MGSALGHNCQKRAARSKDFYCEKELLRFANSVTFLTQMGDPLQVF